jgi:hypothetical protein
VTGKSSNVFFGLLIMMNRDDLGYGNWTARGEIRGSVQDQHLRKRVSETFSLIKGVRMGIEVS